MPSLSNSPLVNRTSIDCYCCRCFRMHRCCISHSLDIVVDLRCKSERSRPRCQKSGFCEVANITADRVHLFNAVLRALATSPRPTNGQGRSSDRRSTQPLSILQCSLAPKAGHAALSMSTPRPARCTRSSDLVTVLQWIPLPLSIEDLHSDSSLVSPSQNAHLETRPGLSEKKLSIYILLLTVSPSLLFSL